MYHPVCINTGMMALPPRGPSSAQQLWKGLCVSSRAEAEKVCREIPELDAWSCSHLQHDALWAAQHKRFAEHPPVSCEGTVRLLGAVQGDGPGSRGFYLNPWVLGLETTEKAWALQHRVFKGLPK